MYVSSDDHLNLTVLIFNGFLQHPILGLHLAGALSDLDWGGWRLIELPLTLKSQLH